MSKQAAKFVTDLLNAATVAHLIHLRGGTLAQHEALGEFYEALPELVDRVAEAYQAKYGIFSYPKTVEMKVTMDPIEFITELSSYVAVDRDICEDSEIQNRIDEIAGQIDDTMYKLKFIK